MQRSGISSPFRQSARSLRALHALTAFAVLSQVACQQEAPASSTGPAMAAPQSQQPATTATATNTAATAPTMSNGGAPPSQRATASMSPATPATMITMMTMATNAGAGTVGAAVDNASAGASAAAPSSAGAGSAGTPATSAGAAAPPTTTPTTGGSGTLKNAQEIVSALHIGWNLGNSLDAVGGETAWGNPLVTPALIDAVAAAGFNFVRVPVTWVRHFGAGPSFTIEPTFMARVQEIVGYVVDKGMYAIINIHHDGAEGGDGEWLSLRDSSGTMNAAHDMAVQQQFVALWSQIAKHFAGHDDKLLFESMNEIKVGYEKPDPAYYKTITALNQAFVDTVRASGGNNMTRSLVVPGYNTNIEYTLEGFVTPTDPSPGRLILSVHYYDPWSFAGSGETHAWGMGSPGADNWGQEAWVDEQFEKLKAKYVSAGLPVIIGEYGAVHQASAQDYRRYYMEYVTKAAVDRGIIPVYWDNGGANSGNDGFGLFNRATGQVLYPEVLKAMLKAATEDYPISAITKPTG